MLLDEVKKLPKGATELQFAMPFSLKILKEVTRFGISAEFVKRLHIYDLQAIIIDFKIDEVRHLQAELRARRSARTGKSIREVAGKEILNYL